MTVLVLALLHAAQGAGAAQESPAFGSTRARGFTVWNSCGVASGQFPADISLHELASRVRPALWFSSQEPLLANGSSREMFIPSAPPVAPDAGAGGRGPTAAVPVLEDHRSVFYRVHRLRGIGPNEVLYRRLVVLAGGKDLLPVVTPEWLDRYGAIDQEAIAALRWREQDLGLVSEITIRYMFYYPLDIGVGDHLHDLEAVDVDLRVSRDNGCLGVFVRRVQASAHGVGLYTNTLDVEAVEREVTKLRSRIANAALRRTLDASILHQPLLMYVESGKHATAPSRDGDSRFDMGTDVNVATTEAWGIRDTMRSNRVAPMFGDEMVSDRTLTEAERAEGDQCDVGGWTDGEDVSRRGRPRWRVCPRDYELVRSTTREDICGPLPGPNAARNQALRRYATRAAELYADELVLSMLPRASSDPRGHEATWLHGLLRGKDFCSGARLDKAANLATSLEDGRIGVAHNSFGRWLESVSVTWRFDRTAGLSVVPPIGARTPLISGWLTGRVTLGRRDAGERLPWLQSADITFTRSASAFLSPYLRVGIDNNVCIGGDASRGACQRERTTDTPGRVRPAWEGGYAIRVKVGGRHAPLWGARLGVRGNGWAEPSHVRFVADVGLTVW